jgi:hypothetical protein
MDIRLRLYVVARRLVQVYYTIVFKRFFKEPEIIC